MLNAPRLLTLASVALLGACATTAPTPAPRVEVIEAPVRVYVPIDKALTRRCPIASGPLSEIPRVSRERRRALEECNAQLEAIEKLRGTPVPR